MFKIKNLNLVAFDVDLHVDNKLYVIRMTNDRVSWIKEAVNGNRKNLKKVGKRDLKRQLGISPQWLTFDRLATMDKGNIDITNDLIKGIK